MKKIFTVSYTRKAGPISVPASADFLSRENADVFASFHSGVVAAREIEDSFFSSSVILHYFADCSWVAYNIQSRSSSHFHADYKSLDEMIAAIEAIRSGSDENEKLWLEQCDFQQCTFFFNRDTGKKEVRSCSIDL